MPFHRKPKKEKRNAVRDIRTGYECYVGRHKRQTNRHPPSKINNAGSVSSQQTSVGLPKGSAFPVSARFFSSDGVRSSFLLLLRTCMYARPNDRDEKKILRADYGQGPWGHSLALACPDPALLILHSVHAPRHINTKGRTTRREEKRARDKNSQRNDPRLGLLLFSRTE